MHFPVGPLRVVCPVRTRINDDDNYSFHSALRPPLRPPLLPPQAGYFEQPKNLPLVPLRSTIGSPHRAHLPKFVFPAAFDFEAGWVPAPLLAFCFTGIKFGFPGAHGISLGISLIASPDLTASISLLTNCAWRAIKSSALNVPSDTRARSSSK